MVSDTTLRGVLSFVKDEESEVKRLEEQNRQESERRLAEETAFLTGAYEGEPDDEE